MTPARQYGRNMTSQLERLKRFPYRVQVEGMSSVNYSQQERQARDVAVQFTRTRPGRRGEVVQLYPEYRVVAVYLDGEEVAA